MSNMFCFQCEQTAKGTGCTVSGVCGKKPETANLQDDLTSHLIELASRVTDSKIDDEVIDLVLGGLFTTVTNVDFDNDDLERWISRIATKSHTLDASGTHEPTFNVSSLWSAEDDVRSLKSLILLGIRGAAAYAYHVRTLGETDMAVVRFFLEALRAIGEDHSIETLLAMVLETGRIN